MNLSRIVFGNLLLINLVVATPGIAQIPVLSKTTNQIPDDIPEEVLRAEIYTEARSPVDGRLLSAREYLELQEQLGKLDGQTAAALVSPKLRDLIELLKLRRTLRQFIPFIP
jgi:hypothetical protein